MSEIPPPMPPAPQPAAPMPGGTPPNNNLVLAIITTVLCCLPLGIFAIIKAAEVNSKWQQGDFMGAQKSADDAKKFSFIGIGVGLVGVILYVILFAAGVVTSSTY